jgi:hypothetical protein
LQYNVSAAAPGGSDYGVFPGLELESGLQRDTQTDANGYEMLAQAPAPTAGYEQLGVLASNDYAMLDPLVDNDYSTFGPLTTVSES